MWSNLLDKAFAFSISVRICFKRIMFEIYTVNFNVISAFFDNCLLWWMVYIIGFAIDILKSVTWLIFICVSRKSWKFFEILEVVYNENKMILLFASFQHNQKLVCDFSQW